MDVIISLTTHTHMRSREGANEKKKCMQETD